MHNIQNDLNDICDCNAIQNFQQFLDVYQNATAITIINVSHFFISQMFNIFSNLIVFLQDFNFSHSLSSSIFSFTFTSIFTFKTNQIVVVFISLKFLSKSFKAFFTSISRFLKNRTIIINVTVDVIIGFFFVSALAFFFRRIKRKTEKTQFESNSSKYVTHLDKALDNDKSHELLTNTETQKLQTSLHYHELFIC